MKNSTKPSGETLSYDTKTILTVLLIIILYPVGVILMFMWMKTWPTWLKIIIALPIILFLGIFVLAFLIGLLAALSGSKTPVENIPVQNVQMSCETSCETMPDKVSCIDLCKKNLEGINSLNK